VQAEAITETRPASRVGKFRQLRATPVADAGGFGSAVYRGRTASQVNCTG
jgi:hypothetical protein